MSRDRIIQIQECAEELGYSTIQEAIDAGYHEVQDLVSGTFTLKHTDAINAEGLAREQEKAHEAWLKEKEEVLRILNDVQELITFWSDNKDHPDAKKLSKVTRFIEGVKYEQ